MIDDISLRRTATGAPQIETPEWVRDAVFYQIFPDRFASSQRVPKPGLLEPWDAPPRGTHRLPERIEQSLENDRLRGSKNDERQERDRS